MFADYVTLVLRHYEQKRAKNEISKRLIQPTPGSIKEECEAVFSSRYLKKDQQILDTYFGAPTEKVSSADRIAQFPLGRFKALQKYVIKKSGNTSLKNIELLAWLIDFEGRPFVHGKNYELDDINQKSGGNTTDTAGDTQEIDKEHVTLETGSDVPQNPFIDNVTATISPVNSLQKYKPIIASIAIFLVSAIAIFFIYGWVKSSRQRCMYWTGNAYVACSCRENHGDTNVIALDTFTLSHLKKIDRPDTISYEDIGSVWYIKTNNKLEYFTAGGNYPADPKRKLNPVTAYMIDKYILRKP